MIKVNLHEAKANLSKYVKAAGRGEQVIICLRNIPVVELKSVKKKPVQRRVGTAKGLGHVPPEFFDPLPEDLLRLYEGEGEAEDVS